MKENEQYCDHNKQCNHTKTTCVVLSKDNETAPQKSIYYVAIVALLPWAKTVAQKFWIHNALPALPPNNSRGWELKRLRTSKRNVFACQSHTSVDDVLAFRYYETVLDQRHLRMIAWNMTFEALARDRHSVMSYKWG